MKRLIFTLAILALTAIAGWFFLVRKNAPQLIIVDEPKASAVIGSPFSFSGKARGNWYFEANFPVKVFDANGAELGVGIAQAEGDWMTEDFVPFSGSVEFRAPETPSGKVVFQKDNPSGLPEHDAAVEVPIRFE